MIIVYYNILYNSFLMWAIQMNLEKEIFDIENEKALSIKNGFSQYPEDWIECYESNLKIGDLVYAEYYPDSQKYLYTHFPECGTVKDIKEITFESPFDGKSVKELSIIILNHNGNLIDLNKDHLSNFSRGYFMNIKKFVASNPKTVYTDEFNEYVKCEIEH